MLKFAWAVQRFPTAYETLPPRAGVGATAATKREAWRSRHWGRAARPAASINTRARKRIPRQVARRATGRLRAGEEAAFCALRMAGNMGSSLRWMRSLET